MSRIHEMLKEQFELIKEHLEKVMGAIRDGIYANTARLLEDCAEDLMYTHNTSWWEHWVDKTRLIGTNYCEQVKVLDGFIDSFDYQLWQLQVQLENTPSHDQQTIDTLKEKSDKVKETKLKAEEFKVVVQALCDIKQTLESICKHIDAFGGS